MRAYVLASGQTDLWATVEGRTAGDRGESVTNDTDLFKYWVINNRWVVFRFFLIITDHYLRVFYSVVVLLRIYIGCVLRWKQNAALEIAQSSVGQQSLNMLPTRRAASGTCHYTSPQHCRYRVNFDKRLEPFLFGRITHQFLDFFPLQLQKRIIPRHHSVTARSLWLLRVLGTICRHHFILRRVHSVNTFRCQLKTFIFVRAF